jgi:hypothetical protein
VLVAVEKQNAVFLSNQLSKKFRNKVCAQADKVNSAGIITSFHELDHIYLEQITSTRGPSGSAIGFALR